MFEWDENKRRSNLAKHGVDFAVIDLFNWTSAIIRVDVRHDYGEERLKAEGLISNRIHSVTYTERGTAKRIISLRKASKKEVLEWISLSG